MVKFSVCLFVCFVVCVRVSSAVSKRNDIDLQTCIDNFDVHKDKIIRTQDSRNMGAKYLNEIDLGSREECLRLCCETDTCDVFVYEEKSPGSCYLFHCGPPEDFKCKFTRHANYSSAVLTVNRHMNELENQIKLTKHEQDLTRLRKPEEVAHETNVRLEVTQVTPTSTPSTTTPKTKVVKEVIPQLEVTKPPTSAGRHCSRYQFECRTSGECIAIYNACDGIPQCLDGSDEAPELGCPDLATTLAPSPPPPPLPRVQSHAFEQPSQLRKSPPVLVDVPYQQSPGVQNNPRLSVPVEASRESADFLRPVPDVRGPAGGQQVPYNEPPMIQSQAQPAFVPPRQSAPNTWIQHPNSQINQMPAIPQNLPYGDKNSHIFNHKDSGLQVMDTPDSGGPSQYADYQKLPNYYADIYRPQYQIPDNWQPNSPSINGDVNPYVGNDNWQPVQIPQTQPINNAQIPNQMYRQNVDVKSNWKADLINTQAESKSYDHTIIREPKVLQQKVVAHNKEAANHEVIKEETEHVTKKSNENSHHPKEHLHVHIATAEELKQDMVELLDGEAERPGGAVLSLTLGVCLTCVMAILIGCRLRIVRRRMRRGGKSPYAHDADYLVNGMYL